MYLNRHWRSEIVAWRLFWMLWKIDINMFFGKNSFQAFYIFPVVTCSPGLDRKSRIIGFWVATLFYIIHSKSRQCRYNSHVKYFHLIFQLNMSTIYSKDHQSLIHLIPYYTDQCASPKSGHTEQGNCSCRSVMIGLK